MLLVRKVTPAAKAKATPESDTFGPNPNSNPVAFLTPIKNVPLGNTVFCSIPLIKITPSTKPDTPVGKVKNLVSNCQPN